jgi:hypothetical protein
MQIKTTDIGKYYIVYTGNDLVLDLGQASKEYYIRTQKEIFETESETEYTNFKNTLDVISNEIGQI